MAWNYLGLLLIVSAVLCSVGFYKYVYFLSIGYGFAVAGIGITIMILGAVRTSASDPYLYLLCVLLVIYGVRLSGFLLFREFKNKSYKKIWNKLMPGESTMPFFVKVVMWICVAILYVAQTSPIFYRLYNQRQANGYAMAGIVICVIALIIESIADYQKTQQKKEHPDRVATQGLYKVVRCPNYFGEILFWTGIFVSGWGILTGTGQWILAVVAYICIVYIMFNGAQRLEKRQMGRYGDNQDYHKYADHTPIIIPLLPLYHLNKKEGVKNEQ